MPGQNAVLVIAATRPWSCANCGTAAELGEFLHMEDAGPLCLDCADLGHLEFLPRGDAALTRRARAASRLSAVVVQWSRTRKRYERQGILAEPEAIVHAESETLGDSGVRERRRALDAERRAAADERFVADFAAAVRAQYPGCPPARARAIASHAGHRGSGRIGRTRSGRDLDPEAVRLAVTASVRHEDTRYDELLMHGVPRADARDQVRPAVNEVVHRWQAEQ